MTIQTLLTPAQAVDWVVLSGAGYCWYNNDPDFNKPVYGALYNWFAASTANICPTGWHVPTDVEFNDMEVLLGTCSGRRQCLGLERHGSWFQNEKHHRLERRSKWHKHERIFSTPGRLSFLFGWHIPGPEQHWILLVIYRA